MPFEFKMLAIPEVRLIIPRVFPDERGSFLETYKETDFFSAGIPCPFVQDNQSLSRQGVLRGLHFQKPPYAQAKLVQVLDGIVFDVVVDLRPGSDTFGRWLGVTLSGNDPSLLYVPAGFAHGFQVVSETALVLYKTSSLYNPAADSGICWNDPDLAISWPIPVPILSAKDRILPPLKAIQT